MWLLGSLTRKPWPFKISSRKQREGDFLYVFQWSLAQKMTFLKNSGITGDFSRLNWETRALGQSVWTSPKSSEFAFTEFPTVHLRRSLAARFLPAWRLQLPQSSRDMSLSSVIILAYSLCACITNHLPALPTRPSGEVMLLSYRIWAKGRESKTSPWIQDTSSRTMSLPIAQITVNKHRLRAWCKTSQIRLRLSNTALGQALVPFIFKLGAQSNYPPIQVLFLIYVHQGWRIVSKIFWVWHVEHFSS